jgi:hypothetical protein
MTMGEGRGTILTLPVFGFFGSPLAPVDLEFVAGVAVLGGAEVGFQPLGVLATQPHGIAIFTLFQAFF